ncbi:hypothetical protein HPB50_002096 [Hyalomma asiaticum]|uniref:Uncharacterized protein n=1 Tax=Hyalomma asiaticum TaxID=266040 RepID=A0ACB7RIV2_HYAAI|nr:hypothetical protein HPB50_002096 [Hyalomma asiaticum]
MESRDTDAVVLKPMRRTRAEERIAVEYPVKPPPKKLRISEEIPFDAYGSDYRNQVFSLSCYDNRADTWDLSQRQRQWKEHPDGPSDNTPSGRYCRWNAAANHGATSSTRSREDDYPFTSGDNDIRYSNEVACHADGIPFTTDKYLVRFTDRDPDGLATNGYVGLDGRDGYYRENTTCTSQDTYSRESKSDVGCFGSRSAIYGDPSRFTDQCFTSGDGDDDHTVETYPQSQCQNNVEVKNKVTTSKMEWAISTKPKLPVSHHAKNFVASKSGPNKVFPNGTELTPQEDEEALAQSRAVATAADSTFVKSIGETSACIKQDTCGTAEESGGDSTSGCALTSGDNHETSSTNGAASESPGAEAAPWQIGPQACPSGYATVLKSLTLHSALQGLHTRRRKLKWPLPIPLLVKPRDKSASLRSVDYALLSQCVYLAAQEEVHAQTLDEKGWLRIFVATPRAAHFLVQTETLAGVLVKCSVVSSYTNSIGYIRSVPRRYTDTAIFEMLQEEGVICAQRQSGFMCYRKGAVRDVATGTVVLTFLPDRRLPTTVTVGLLTFEVLQRLSLPTQCFNCQRFGHYAEQCKMPISCKVCAGVHLYSECTKKDQPRCVNCGEPHPSTYWKCPVRLARASSDPRNSLVETLVKV